MKSKAYWQNRAAKRMYLYQVQADKVANEIAGAYIKSTNAINAEVDKIFRTFQVDGGLSESEARKLLSNLPDNATLDHLKSVINAVNDPEKRRALLNIINSPAYAYRIKRFEQLQKDIDTQTARLAQFEQNTTKAHYVNLTSDAYYRSIFDVQRGTGIGFSFARMPISRVNSILTDDWSGKLFSARIWGRASGVNAQLKEELLVGFMTGRSYKKTAAAIEERMGVSANAARRLVRTESTYVANAAEMASYKECDIDKYEFVATLDMRTSDVCAALDGKQFDVDKGVPGTNMPPMHAWCRSTTIAVIDGAVTEGLKRRARDPETGETYEVPADMTYGEWKNAYVDTEGERYTRKDYENIEKTKVSWDVIESDVWRENFERISENAAVNNTLRNVAEQMLKHRDGTFYEDMYLINASTGKIEGFNTTCQIKQRVALNDSLERALSREGVELIAVHNHPFSSVPSLSDLNSIAKRSSQRMGVIICHDGTIFTYTKPVTEIRQQDYNKSLTKHKKYSKITREDKGFEDLGFDYEFEYRRLET